METILKKLLEYQKKKRNALKEKSQKMLVLLDDVDLNKRSEILNLFSFLGRHIYCWVIVSCQYAKMLVSSGVRSNVDYYFFNQMTYQGYEAIYRSIPVPMKFNDFMDWVKQNMFDYRFIMYDTYENKLSIVKAKLFKSIKLS